MENVTTSQIPCPSHEEPAPKRPKESPSLAQRRGLLKKGLSSSEPLQDLDIDLARLAFPEAFGVRSLTPARSRIRRAILQPADVQPYASASAAADHTNLPRDGHTYTLNDSGWALTLTFSTRYEFVGNVFNVTPGDTSYQVDPSALHVSLQFLLEGNADHKPTRDDTDLTFKIDAIPSGRDTSGFSSLLHYPTGIEGRKALRKLVLTFSSSASAPHHTAPTPGNMAFETSATSLTPGGTRHCATHIVYSRKEPDRYHRESTSYRTAFLRARPEKRVIELDEMRGMNGDWNGFADLKATGEYLWEGDKHGVKWWRIAACGWKKM